MNANGNTNTDTIVAASMDSYHEGLLKHVHMNRIQFNENYKAKNMITTFPSAPPVASTLVLAAQLSAQLQDYEEQRDASNGSTFGTQEDHHHPPQRQTPDKRPLNAPAFET